MPIKHTTILLGAGIGLFLCPSFFVFATDCGDVIYSQNGQDQRAPIENCTNPFDVSTSTPHSDISYTIAGTDVTEGDTVYFATGTNEIEITTQIEADLEYESYIDLYRHDGSDYRLVLDNTESLFSISATGTYTLVVSVNTYADFSIYLPSSNPGTAWWNWLVPTAYAAQVAPTFYETHSLTFTVAEPVVEPEPTGASSVLFLPGIQASRLYKGGLVGSEDQLWTPTNAYSQDIRQLEMSEGGQSVNDVYTRDVLDSVRGMGSVYGGLLDHLADLRAQEVISSYQAFAYDWRFSPDSIVQQGTEYEFGVVSLIKTVEKLAEEADGRQVTIVAHSNGGLVAKALMQELEKQDKESLIDQIIFIGTPHLGTPKSIGTILHGYDESVSFLGIPIIQTAVAREVINNMPGAYGLLPTPAYFSLLSEPMVTIADTSATADLHDAYGQSISDYQEFRRFLSGQDGLNRSLSQSVSTPAKVNNNLYQSAVNEHINLLDSWQAPDTIAVTQVVGTGLPTMNAIQYREIEQEKCITAGPGGVVCGVNKILKPFAQLTHDGDETVVSQSASAYAGENELYFVDLEKLNLQNFENAEPFSKHYNLTEASEVQQLITDTLLATTSNHSYVAKDKPEIDTTYDIEVIDSPVRPFATDNNGNVTGLVLEDEELVIKNEIPNSQYFSLGETKYLILPSDTERTTTLMGEGSGGYTLTLATLDQNDEQEIYSMLENASVTPAMVATYQKSSAGYSEIETDFNDDGVIDLITTVTGEVVEQPINKVTFADLRSALENLGLSTYKQRFLNRLVDRAEYYIEKPNQNRWYVRIAKRYLHTTSGIVSWYERLNLIEEAENDGVQNVITELLKEI